MQHRPPPGAGQFVEIGVAAHQHHRQAGLQLAQAPGGLPAVQTGHGEVHQGRLEHGPFSRNLQSGFAAVGDLHLAAQFLEELAGDLAHVRVIIDQEHP